MDNKTEISPITELNETCEISLMTKIYNFVLNYKYTIIVLIVLLIILYVVFFWKKKKTTKFKIDLPAENNVDQNLNLDSTHIINNEGIMISREINEINENIDDNKENFNSNKYDLDETNESIENDQVLKINLTNSELENINNELNLDEEN